MAMENPPALFDFKPPLRAVRIMCASNDASK